MGLTTQATATPQAYLPTKATNKNADGCTATFIQDSGTVQYNSRASRIEVDDDGSITIFKRADAKDPGTAQVQIKDGKILGTDGQWHPLQPVATFNLEDGTKMTVTTTTPEDGGKPVSKVTITNTDRNGRNHAIDRRDKNNNFGLEISNVGGNGALNVVEGSGRELDKATDDGEENNGANYRINGDGTVEMDCGDQVGQRGHHKKDVFKDIVSGGDWQTKYVTKGTAAGLINVLFGPIGGAALASLDKGENLHWDGLGTGDRPNRPDRGHDAASIAAAKAEADKRERQAIADRPPVQGTPSAPVSDVQPSVDTATPPATDDTILI